MEIYELYNSYDRIHILANIIDTLTGQEVYIFRLSRVPTQILFSSSLHFPCPTTKFPWVDFNDL